VNRLFIELYLDEGVAVLVAELLRSRGFKVLTTREAGNLQTWDDDQLAFATQHGLTFFTHNRVHFENLAREYVSQGRCHHGRKP